MVNNYNQAAELTSLRIEYTCILNTNLKKQRELAAIIKSIFFFLSLKGHSCQNRFLVTAGRQLLYTSSKKEKKVIQGNYRLVKLTSVPQERIFLEHISEHVKVKVTGKS